VLVALSPLLASNAAFFIVFGIFVIALLVLVVVTSVWVIRRDKAGRAAWLERQSSDQDEQQAGPSDG
jgi:hypothetical protein